MISPEEELDAQDWEVEESQSEEDDGLDAMSESSESSVASNGSFFSALDRVDRKRKGELDSQELREEWRPKWVRSCPLHKGESVDLTVRLPDPCPECLARDGHGQKARVFAQATQAEGSSGFSFEAEFAKQRRRGGKSSVKRLIPFRKAK